MSIDWTSSMAQTYEFYIVDPVSWTDRAKVSFINSCDITFDASSAERGSASFSMDRMIEECYIRPYMLASQNGVTERHPLGTYLVQTANTDRYSNRLSFSVDGYTPLHELSENSPPNGYFVSAGTNIMNTVYDVVSDHARAPIVRSDSDAILYDNFVANGDDTWLSFVIDLLAKDNKSIDLDEFGRIVFVPNSTIEESGVSWEFSDDRRSILDPSVGLSNDVYGIPNVVEVTYSSGNVVMFARAENNDRTSPVSIIRRGREILYRDNDPSIVGRPSQEELDEYAKSMLEKLSMVQYTINYKHGYCPIRVGDCIRLNYSGNGLTNVKAKITSQSVSCTTGALVSETAVFTEKLWERGR